MGIWDKHLADNHQMSSYQSIYILYAKMMMNRNKTKGSLEQNFRSDHVRWNNADQILVQWRNLNILFGGAEFILWGRIGDLFVTSTKLPLKPIIFTLRGKNFGGAGTLPCPLKVRPCYLLVKL